MTEKFKAIIIEDEEPARELIKHFIADFQNIEIVCECNDGFTGLKAIKEIKPQIVFLDIEMPKITGLEILDLIEQKPAIIFTTAYNQYAINAFEKNAIDYLLKPFSKERFVSAVEKAINSIKNNLNNINIKTLRSDYQTKNSFLTRVAVKKNNDIIIIPIEKLIYIQADDDYVVFYSNDGKYMKNDNLSYYEENLNPENFIRIHRSYIVALNQIAKLEKYGLDSYVVILKNGISLKVSKSNIKKIKDALRI